MTWKLYRELIGPIKHSFWINKGAGEAPKVPQIIGTGIMQAKNIPDRPILEFLASIAPNWGVNGFGLRPLPDNSVARAMPQEVPDKLGRAKMGQLIKRGLTTGCACGCRGGYELTAKGREMLENNDAVA